MSKELDSNNVNQTFDDIWYESLSEPWICYNTDLQAQNQQIAQTQTSYSEPTELATLEKTANKDQ